MVDLAARDLGRDVGAREVQRVDFQRRQQRGARRLLRRAVEHRLERDVAELRELGADRARRVLLPRQHRCRDDAHTLDGNDAARGDAREGGGALANPAGRRGVGDDQAGAGREATERAVVGPAPAAKDEPIGQPELLRGARDLLRALQREGVHAVRCVSIVRRQLVKDHERPVEPVRLEDGEAQRPVLVEPLGALHPVEHQLTFGDEPRLVGARSALRDLVADEGRSERVHEARKHRDLPDVPG